jgi:hypothetical protein
MRLAPYLAAVGGDTERALTLYEWNITTSAAVYEVLHRFEVGLRNAIDPRLCMWNATQVDPRTGRRHGADWLLDPSRLLGRLAAKAITDATPRAQRAAGRGRAARTVLHDDVLAATSLGTWRYLLPDRDPGRQRLWTDAVHQAFPHLPASATGPDVTAKVHDVLLLRNRVAHLEPLLNVGRTQRHIGAAYTVASWIGPELRDWITSTQRVTEAMRARRSI